MFSDVFCVWGGRGNEGVVSWPVGVGVIEMNGGIGRGKKNEIRRVIE